MTRSRDIEIIARQRNIFMVVSIVLVMSCLLLAVKIASSEDRVILVPGLNQEVWVSREGVSSSYLEEAASMYIPMLLDLDYTSIDWKRERLLSHVSRSDNSYLKALTEYFARTKEQYKQFAMSTYFAVKKLEVNRKDLKVKAYGQLISRFGENGFEVVPAIYGLSFEWLGGKLLLQEFVRLKQEEN